jgi:polyhydroxyalkanoate synthesis regulator phasin
LSDRKKGNVGDEVREGIRAGLGILSALKDAVEETFEDMMDRGELSQDRAREAMKKTMDRAAEAFEDTRARFDFVPRVEYDELVEDVKELRRRVERLENQAHEHAPPEPDAGS